MNRRLFHAAETGVNAPRYLAGIKAQTAIIHTLSLACGFMTTPRQQIPGCAGLPGCPVKHRVEKLLKLCLVNPKALTAILHLIEAERTCAGGPDSMKPSYRDVPDFPAARIPVISGMYEYDENAPCFRLARGSARPLRGGIMELLLPPELGLPYK